MYLNTGFCTPSAKTKMEEPPAGTRDGLADGSECGWSMSISFLVGRDLWVDYSCPTVCPPPIPFFAIQINRIARSSFFADNTQQQSLACEGLGNRRSARRCRSFRGHRRVHASAGTTYSPIPIEKGCLPLAAYRPGCPQENRAAKPVSPKIRMPGMPAGHSDSAMMNRTVPRHVGLLSSGSKHGLRRAIPARTGTG